MSDQFKPKPKSKPDEKPSQPLSHAGRMAAILSGAAVLAALLAVLGLWALVPGPERTRVLASPTAGDPTAPGTLNNRAAMQSPGLVTLVGDYKRWAQYPPNSRPLRPGHTDVIFFRRIKAPVQTMPWVQSGKVKTSGYACQLQARTHTITEGEAQLVFLSCWRQGKPDRVALSMKTVRLQARAGVRRRDVSPPDFRDDGQQGDAVAGDHIYTARFEPHKKDWANMHLTVNFQIQSKPQLHSLATHFFSSPSAPARFSGTHASRVHAGSLVTQVGLHVLRAGRYTVEANLFAGDQPVAYARKDAALKTGSQSLELRFFGKLIRDAGRSGPYTIRGLRGSLNTDVIQPEMLTRPPQEVARLLSRVRQTNPKRMVMPYLKQDLHTEAFAVHEFSARVYDSAEKRRRLQQLSSLAR